VLLADDEPALRTLLTRFLERLGYTVLAEASGAEALARAERHPGRLWLVITDVDMPGMSGAELARALGVPHPDTPVLFISGRPAPRDLSDAVVGRPAAFLAKPFALAELRAAMTALAGDPRGSETRGTVHGDPHGGARGGAAPPGRASGGAACARPAD
jgi:CheY-like chemotaxis protein